MKLGSDLQQWTENRPTRGARAVRLTEVWAYRELIGFLALRDLKARYKQAAFSVAWALLQPLAGVAVFTLVFRRLAQVPSDGIPYPLFALLGLSVWTYFSASLSAATTSMVANAALVTKVYFPRLVAPLAALLPGLVDLAVSLTLVAVLMAVLGVAPGAALLAFPIFLLALMATALGAGLLLATLNVRYRDVGKVTALLLQLWLFLSPVAYPSSQVPERWAWAYGLNPMAGVIDGIRWSLLGGPAPGAELVVSALAAVILLSAGIRYFQASERQFADVI